MHQNTNLHNTEIIHVKRQLPIIKNMRVISRYFKGTMLLVDLCEPAGVQVCAEDAVFGLYGCGDDDLEGALLGHYKI